MCYIWIENQEPKLKCCVHERDFKVGVAVTENIVVTWNIFAMTLMSVVKTLHLFKWSLMAGTDDLFMGRFLFLVNLGLCFCVQLSRYWLGSMYESHEFQILSGIMVSDQINLFQIMLFIFCKRQNTSFASTTMCSKLSFL